MLSKKGFNLTEVLLAVSLMSLIILVVTSLDITSRRFFGNIGKQAYVQDEARITMEHIVKNIQLGIGNMTNPGTIGSPPAGDNSRGFYIFDNGNLALSGSHLQVKQDTNGDGTVEIIDYTYDGTVDEWKIICDDGVNPPYDLAKGIIQGIIFEFTHVSPNRVKVTITSRDDPTQAAESLDNPETTLTSSIVLRAMSCN